MLAGKGFERVYNVKGGIMAWEGPVAEGPVELNLHLVTGDETPEAVIRVAYGMEMSLGRFYTTMAPRTDNADVAALMEKLASIEERHKEFLIDLHGSVTGEEPDRESIEAQVKSSVMEGGFAVDDFIRDNDQFLGTVQGVLDLSMMLEAQALDLYLRFAQKIDNERSKEILFRIADEEKAHLASLGRLREEHS